MGISFCGFRRRPRPNGPPPEKDSAMMNKLMAAMNVKKRRLCPPEKKPDHDIDDSCKQVIITLEDLIVSSPGAGFNIIHTGGGGGAETPPVHKQSSSRKIHPSSDGDLKQSLLLPISAEFNLPSAVESGSSSSLSRTKSGKARKKVSFRSPEVADVFLLHHSPPPLDIIRT
ncbi:hypothetical protein C2S51_013388 [Perilla frutescens var. frutescens]|nr:hypothetical protein C2S51_013388 [Perilla frutescens var. frutescens]